MSVAGLADDLGELLGVHVDVVAQIHLRNEASATALTAAVAM